MLLQIIGAGGSSLSFRADEAGMALYGAAFRETFKVLGGLSTDGKDIETAAMDTDENRGEEDTVLFRKLGLAV